MESPRNPNYCATVVSIKKRFSKLREITINEVPSPFSNYLLSKHYINRPGSRYFLCDDGELFIANSYKNGRDVLGTLFIEHWTNQTCCGILLFMRDNNIERKTELTYCSSCGNNYVYHEYLGNSEYTIECAGCGYVKHYYD